MGFVRTVSMEKGGREHGRDREKIEGERERERDSVSVWECVCGPTHATPHKTTHNVTKTN